MDKEDLKREKAFLDKIDARFPYNDKNAATAVIREGVSISPNAAFCVLEEICRPERGKVSEERQKALLAEWRSVFSHPLVAIVEDAISALVDDTELTSDRALEMMDEISAHQGQFCALNIVYFAADPDDELDERSENIAKQWTAEYKRRQA